MKAADHALIAAQAMACPAAKVDPPAARAYGFAGRTVLYKGQSSLGLHNTGVTSPDNSLDRHFSLPLTDSPRMDLPA